MPKRVSEREGEVLRRDNPTEGIPRWYYLLERTENVNGVSTPTVRFIPPAREDYDIVFTYYRLPRTVNADADILDIPDTYSMAIVAMATGNLWLKELNGGTKAQEQ